jgi:hypothetical protein
MLDVAPPEPRPEPPFVRLGPDNRDDQHRDVLYALHRGVRQSPLLRLWAAYQMYWFVGDDLYLNPPF